jgi:nucleoside-diphosphate-sugar epimerase
VQYPTFSDHARRIIELPLSGKPATVERGGKQLCDFVYVKDVAQAIINACVVDDPRFGVFNIGAGELRTLFDFVDVIKRRNPDAEVSVGEEPNPAYPFMGPVDISRARAVLDYTPTPFSECMEDYVTQAETMRVL